MPLMLAKGRCMNLKLVCCVILISTGLLGCTAAQFQSTQIHNVGQRASTELRTCVVNVFYNPEYASVVTHLASPETGQPTMAQLADTTYPSEQESQLLVHLHDDLIPCHQAALQQY